MRRRFAVLVPALVAVAACLEVDPPVYVPPPSLSGTWVLRDSLVTTTPHGALRDVRVVLGGPTQTSDRFAGVTASGQRITGFLALTYEYPRVGFTLFHTEGSAHLDRAFNANFDGALIGADTLRGWFQACCGIRGDTAVLVRQRTP